MTQDQHIRTLQCLLQHAEDFHEILSYFMDNLGENREFLARGKYKKNSKLKTVLGAVTRYQLGFEGEPQLALEHLRRYGMWHGAVKAGAQMGQVLYFESPDIGLVVFPDIATGQLAMIRFRVKTEMLSTLITPAPAPQHGPN